MPTYTYSCRKCNYVKDVFHGMSVNPRIKCDDCGKGYMKRELGTGAGIIFKGSGFYETDYKRSGTKPSGSAKESKADAAPKKETKSSSSDNKSAAKTAKAD